ncbi:MAG TPA: general stress protein [Ramlibacter sp.]|nr:general stress protein [Ramlibacter sp.]
MQTLISVFDDRSDARKAVERLVQSGFSRDDVHIHENAQQQLVRDEEGIRELGDHTMGTAEREIAMDRGVLDSLGHFFVSLFGKDHGPRAASAYGDSLERGQSVVIVDARNDQEAESAAVTLHECGAIEVEDRDSAGGTPSLPGVRMYERESAPLRDLAQQRNLREESLMSDRAGQVSKEMKEDREERAYASSMNHVDRDRPK